MCQQVSFCQTIRNNRSAKCESPLNIAQLCVFLNLISCALVLHSCLFSCFSSTFQQKTPISYRFEGADDSSKTRLNLVFEHMCNIVVCIPVKVYNMKKKTVLIVTFVSITSLYFYYI